VFPSALVDPIPNYRYGLEVGGVLVGGFMSCSGIETHRETKELAEGGINDHVHVLPGRLVQGNVTLARGITYTSFLWEWFHWGMTSGQVLHLPVVIFRYDTAGLPVNIWPILSTYPAKWVGRELQAGSRELAVETLELACGAAAGQGGREAEGGAGGGEDKGKKKSKAAVNYAALALKVLDVLRTEACLERERAGRLGIF
jgi:phage tail-like protein